MSRKPVQIVEMDIDYCAEVYGVGPCTASLTAATCRKCFNTYFTCQSKPNFNKGTLTLRYAKNQTGLPKEALIYPALKSVSTNPTQINLGGIDKRTGPLGKRARVTVEFHDFTDSDTYTDKYQSGRRDGTAQFDAVGYNPLSLGTHFGKQRRRNPYYIGRALRILEGYEGEALSAMRTKHFVMAEWAGPSMSGGVRVIAKDVFDLADNDKALCPKPSIGKLDRAIAASGNPVFELIPAGAGAEYDASGRASIGSEIVTFTRATDTITITGRAMDGSSAATHSTDDLFQQCYRVEGQSIAEVAADLLENFAGIDASFLPVADWADEMAWLAGLNLTATIPRSTGVTKLMGELGQHGVIWWWDDVAQKVKMRANRPVQPGETLLELNDSDHIKEGSLIPFDLHKQRLTQVIFWHGQIDATGSATSGENFRRAYTPANDGGSANKYNQDRVLEIYSRWLGDGNDAIAGAVAERLINRFQETPRQVELIIDAKDRENVGVADLAILTTRALQDEIGQSLATEMQITAVEEHQPGHALKVTAQSHQFQGRFGFWLQDPQQDYDTAPDADKEFGAFWFDDTQPDFGDGTGPYQYF